MNKTEVDSDKLKLRERKTLLKLKHYLKTVYAQPFDMNYYAGDWMMGPTFHCKQPICNIGKHLHDMLKILKPENLQDVETIKAKLQTNKKGNSEIHGEFKDGKIARDGLQSRGLCFGAGCAEEEISKHRLT